MQKLFIIIRNDLDQGLQAAQACHATKLFGMEHPKEDIDWYRNSNNIVLLQVPDKYSLIELAYEAICQGCACSVFREPDVGDEPTAIAICGRRAKKVTSHLPLALRQAA